MYNYRSIEEHYFNEWDENFKYFKTWSLWRILLKSKFKLINDEKNVNDMPGESHGVLLLFIKKK